LVYCYFDRQIKTSDSNYNEEYKSTTYSHKLSIGEDILLICMKCIMKS